MNIHLGYEVGTGRAVEVPLTHTAVTGQTQASGKTTTLEALIHRSERRTIAFLTKRGEGAFQSFETVPPYFSEAVDWLFVKELLEATAKTKMKFETSWIIEVSKGARNLQDVKRNLEVALRGVPRDRTKSDDDDDDKKKWIRKPASGMSQGIYTVLDAYLERLIPQIEALKYEKTLNLQPGLNVMDLREYSTEMQGLVVRSVLEWVYQREKKVIVVIPEAWELIPQDRGSPVKLAAEQFIRKGAVLENYLFLDSQDLAGVHKAILRQVGVWIMGVQREANEVMRTLKQFIAQPARPRPDDLMQLTKGQFLVAHGNTQHTVYVQPRWMGAVHARAIAMGEEPVESAVSVYRDYCRQFEKRAKKEIRAAEQAGPAATDTVRVANSGENAQPKRGADMQRVGDDPRGAVTDSLPGDPSPRSSVMGQKESPTMGASFNGDSHSGVAEAMNIHSMYLHIRDRLLQDPRVLEVISHPVEIRVTVQPMTLSMDGESLQGQIALLLHEGFFEHPKKGYAVWQELVERRCKKFAKPSVYDGLNAIARMGFLVKDADDKYAPVAGMKVSKANR